MELSLNILFYFAYRWKTKIISHKTESFYFHQNIWKSDFILNVDTQVQCDFGKGPFSRILWAGVYLETGFGYYLKHPLHTDTICFKKCQTSQKLPVKAAACKIPGPQGEIPSSPIQPTLSQVKRQVLCLYT